jgi:hypothetical protein
MSSPAKVTDSDSGLSRLPPQAGQSALTRYCATRFLIDAVCVVANVVST